MGPCQIRAASGLIVTTHVAETAMPEENMKEWMKKVPQGISKLRVLGKWGLRCPTLISYYNNILLILI